MRAFQIVVTTVLTVILKTTCRAGTTIGFDLKSESKTDVEDSGQWSMYYLDRLEVSCLDDTTSSINQFQIQLNPDPKMYEWWYTFTCVTAGFPATTSAQTQMVSYEDANREDNVEWLDRIGAVDCSSTGGVLSQFKMVNTENPDENGYAFTCSTFGTFPLSSCRIVTNTYTSVGSSKGSANNANYLSLQNIECEANEAIQSFRYQDTYPEATGGYEYVCCQYNPSCSPGFGYIPESGTCSQCYSGTYSPGGTSSCLTCEAGYTSLDMADSCYVTYVVSYPEDYPDEEYITDTEYYGEDDVFSEGEYEVTDDDWYYYLSTTIDAESTCNWIDGDNGVAFDLLPLMITVDTEYSYIAEDQNKEGGYKYVWNVCDKVTTVSLPSQCLDKQTVMSNHVHAVYQYKGTDECYVLGKFFSQKNFTYALIDPANPAIGISLTYEKGEKCNSNYDRESVIDIYCSNVEVAIDEAEEQRTCSYHMVMESYYGCPTTCAITARGLCDSAGTCVYDAQDQYAYCQCFDGFGGDDCSKVLTVFDTITSFVPYYVYEPSSSSFTQIQIAITVILAVGAFGLCAGIGVVGYRHVMWRSDLGYSSIPQKDEFLEGNSNL